MSPDNTEKLFRTYADLFEPLEVRSDPKKSCMAWGFECGDGWFELVDDCLRKIQATGLKTQILQVKEKFGTLRIYYSDRNEMISGLVKAAAELSAVTCENCGSAGQTTQVRGWLLTRCTTCLEEWKARKQL